MKHGIKKGYESLKKALERALLSKKDRNPLNRGLKTDRSPLKQTTLIIIGLKTTKKSLKKIGIPNAA